MFINHFTENKLPIELKKFKDKCLLKWNSARIIQKHGDYVDIIQTIKCVIKFK